MTDGSERPGPAELRGRALQFCVVMNQLLLDLQITVVVMRHFEKEHNSGRRHLNADGIVMLLRMCYHHAALVLCRFEELVARYRHVIPRDVRRRIWRPIIAEMDQRHVRDYRDVVVVHLFDKHGTWTSPSEINRRFADDLNMGVPGSFAEWIAAWPGEDGPERPRLIAQFHAMRDAVAEAHGISREELLAAVREA